jgi:AcrR family transcriptional regulator
MVNPSPARKTSAKRGTDRTLASRLGRDDWLDAAFRAAVDHSFDRVRVLSLAEDLKVTRGSFYWHFKDHAELIAALIERWRAREIALYPGLQSDADPDPVKDIEAMLDTVLAFGGEDLNNIRFELALRGLGRRDAVVATMLRKTDDMRIALFTRKFVRLVGDEKTAADLATLFYLSVVGSYHALIRPQTAISTKRYFLDIIAKYLVQQQLR